MSFVPYMKYSAKRGQQQIVNFGGLRYGRGGNDGDFSETLNLSSNQFPTLSQRRGRKLFKKYEKPTAMYARTKLIVVDGTNVIYDGETVGQVTEGEKIITSVNTKIIIFPDKKYYDIEQKKFGDMAIAIEVASGSVTWGTETLKITGQGDLTEKFAVGQAVEISNSSITDNNKFVVIRELTADTITVSKDAFKTGTESNTIKVERKIPDLTCICESSNRLWGAEGKTIWASAQGDPLTFYNYDGLATDSFAVAVGTDGEFTGCAAYSSNVLFFKENTLHKVLGSAPSEYRVYDYTIPGVQSGSQKSMVVINEVLYYKGAYGVYAYSGASPSLITENFGTRRFKNARGGTDGTRYYISMQDDDDAGAWNLFVLDPITGVWLREDDSHVIDFARQDTMIHGLFEEEKAVYILDQDVDERISWEALFYPFDDTVFGKRGYSKLWMKMEMEKGAWIKAFVSQDGGPFRRVGTWSNDREETITAPIFPGRCDTFRLKLQGEGKCVIKSLVREFILDSER